MLAKKLYDGQFTLSTQLIEPNYRFILSHQRITTVSLEKYPLFHYFNYLPDHFPKRGR